jgi:hypothetical protein
MVSELYLFLTVASCLWFFFIAAGRHCWLRDSFSREKHADSNSPGRSKSFQRKKNKKLRDSVDDEME